MRLWGGESDTGCCSVSDVDDARRVAQQLGIDHLVFNFSADFTARVVEPYVADHAAGRTPNPCIECNRHLKFDRLLERADRLGFDAVATGHYARILDGRVARAVDRAKDQSYVVHTLDADQLARLRFPIGELAKADVRARAAELGLRTAAKPDSQDVCFITTGGGRAEFLGRRMQFTAGTVIDTDGNEVGRVDALELITVGQRRGVATGGGGERRYVTAVDQERATVTVGPPSSLLVAEQPVHTVRWAAEAPPGEVLVQCSAHGGTQAARVEGATVAWVVPQHRVAPGQSVVFYDPSDTWVVGGATAA